MSKRTRNNIVLLITLFYLVFACLYVVACGESNRSDKTSSFKSARLLANHMPYKDRGHLMSKPRVINQKLLIVIIAPVIALSLFIMNAGSMATLFKALPVPFQISPAPNIIKLSNLRL
jgi:hypothetical protein